MGKLVWLGKIGNNDPHFFKKVARIKNRITADELCYDRAKLILPFVTDIFGLGYYERPNYSKLKFMLVRALLCENQAPSVLFDWSKFRLPKHKSKASGSDNYGSSGSPAYSSQCGSVPNSEGSQLNPSQYQDIPNRVFKAHSAFQKMRSLKRPSGEVDVAPASVKMNLDLNSADNLKLKIQLIKRSQQSQQSYGHSSDEISIDARGQNDVSVRFEQQQEESVKVPIRYNSNVNPQLANRLIRK